MKTKLQVPSFSKFKSKTPLDSVPTPTNDNNAQALLDACWHSKNLHHQIGILDRQSGIFKNQSIEDTDEAIALAKKHSEQGRDTYFAMAEFATADNRKADNTVGACCFWMDIDCGIDKAESGKGYLTKEEALDALTDFCNDAGIPMATYIIDSGNGLHVYWILDGQLERKRWQKSARKLKELTHQLELKADDSRTADIASVLRIPGTLNHKGKPAKPVTVIEAKGKRINIDMMLEAINTAHQKLCVTPEKGEEITATLPMTTSSGPALKRLKAALSVLEPDCSEEKWKFKRLAPLALLAREHPEYAEKIKLLAKEWSRGDLQDKSSQKWTAQGNNGLTGKEAFETEWQRFLSPTYDGNYATVDTIYYDAQVSGWVDTNLTKLDPLPILQDTFCLIKMAGKFWVIDREALAKNVRNIEFFNRNDAWLLLERKANELFGEVEIGKILRTFFTSKDTVCFDGVEFNPLKTTDNYLNLWVGPTLQAEKGDWKGIEIFLRNIICNGDEEIYHYLIRYLAHAIQKPEEKPGVIIIMLGGQGIGKGTFGRIFQMIWESSYLQVHNIAAITGNFNAALEKSFIIFMDEALFSGDRRSADALKSLVTEPTIYINEKHQPARQMSSFHRFIAATNADHFKNTESDDRRDFVLRVSDERKHDAEYWCELNHEMSNGGVSAMLNELQQMDISDFNVRVKPSTEALIEQKIMSLDYIGRWWYDCLDQGSIIENDDTFETRNKKDNEWPEFLSTTNAIDSIKESSGGRIYKTPIARDIQQALTKMCPSAIQRQRKVGGSRKRGLVLPILEQSRLEFEAYLSGSVNWTKMDEVEEVDEGRIHVEESGKRITVDQIESSGKGDEF
jgi:Family of unknown function (DUF5906)